MDLILYEMHCCRTIVEYESADEKHALNGGAVLHRSRSPAGSVLQHAAVRQSFLVIFLLLEEASETGRDRADLSRLVPLAGEPARLTIAQNIAINSRFNNGRSVSIYRMVSNVEQRRSQIQQRSGSGVFET